MALTRRTVGLASLGVLAAPHIARAEDPVRIGFIMPVTGPAAEAGAFQLNGVRLAAEGVNERGVLGRRLEVVAEDDQTTNPGAVLAFSRLAARPEIVAFIGSVRSTQIHAMAPDVLKTGKPMMIGGTDPTLTHMGNRWLFRCRPNDSYSAKVIAEFGSRDLGMRKWAIVYSTDAFGTNGSKLLAAELIARGITLVLSQGYTNQTNDFSAIALAVKQSGADVLGSYMTFEGDLGIFARQLRQLGVGIPWVGSPSISNLTALRLAGSALYGTYGVTDYAVEATPASTEFAGKYKARYNATPDNLGAWGYDAVSLLAHAITNAGSLEPEAIRAATLKIRGYAGAEGEYNFDESGDGLHGYNVVRNDAGKSVFVRRVDFPAT